MARRALIEAGAVVRLYGPDHAGGKRVLERMIDRYDMSDIVVLAGPITGAAKSRAFREADLFVMTSRTEGHPSSVLEALAHGVPCLLTPETNMAGDVAGAGAGWEMAPTPQGIADRMTEAVSRRNDWPTMSRNARSLAIREYAWHRIALKTVERYREII
jgi:glycosyltransferase involved in cell wall biosynthesis